MASRAHTKPKRVTRPSRMRPAARDGYVLVPVVMGILLIALAALLLNTESAINAAEVSSLHDAARAEHVAQSAIERAIWRAKNDACGGDFVIAPTALGLDQYEVTTTGGASSTAYTLSADQDAWIRNDDPTRNNGSSTWNHIRFELGNTEQILTRFDLSSLPAGSEIQSATAWFYIKNLKPHPEGPITVHAITADWGELTVNWDSFGSEFSSDRLATIPAQDMGAVWVGINLTAQVQAWVNGTPNFGILFRSTSDGTHTEYTGRADSTNPPRLEVIAGNGPTSPLDIVATGKLANGITRSLGRTSTPAYQPSDIVTLRLGTDPGEDAFLDSFYPRNYGGADYAQVNENPGWQQRPVFRFGLSGIPVDASVVSARLELRLRDLVAPGSISVHRLARGWIEGTKSGTGTPNGATWETYDGVNDWTSAGGDFDAIPVSETVVDASDTWVAWEIAPLVEQWLAGAPNHGVLLKSDGVLEQAEFYSREETDPTLRPRLTITYACECGRPCMVPQGVGTITMVVINPTTLVTSDANKKTLFESWGYTVDVIGESSNESEYDAKVATSDAFFISETVNSGQVGGRLVDVPIGVVSQDGDYNNDLGIAGGSAWTVNPAINVIDPSHFITAIFPAGPVDIYSEAMEQLTISGGAAAGSQTLADTGGAGSLVALDTGDALLGGGSAAGRRVMLPLGREPSMNWDYLNNRGRLVVHRAIAWAMGAGSVASSSNVLFVVGDPSSLTTQESAKKALIESWGYGVNLIDDAASPTDFVDAFAVNNIVYVSGDATDASAGPSLLTTSLGVVNEQIALNEELLLSTSTGTNDFNSLSVVDDTHYITDGFSTGWLSITTVNQPLNALQGTLAPGLQNLAEVWISGANYDYGLAVVDTGGALNGGEMAAGRRVQIPWGTTGFDFSTLNDNGKTIMRRAIEWAAGANFVLAGPVAHWRLDDGTGITAVDSEGGNDGTLTSGPIWVAGQLGGALDFDGADDYVAVPAFDVSGNGLTMSGWFNAETIPTSDGRIVSKANGPNEADAWWQLSTTDSGSDRFLRMRVKAGGSTTTVADSTVDLTTGRWYFAAATYDEATGDMRLYLDGTEIASGSHAVGGPVDAGPAVPVAIGANGTIERFFDGVLDDVRIYDRALSATEVTELYTAGGGGGVPFVCDGIYRDDFDDRIFSGSNGSIDWSSTPWEEIGEADGPTSGDLIVINDESNYQLRVRDGDYGTERLINLDGAATASLDLLYRRSQLDNSGDYVALWVSTNGTAGPWIELERFGTNNDTSYQAYSIDMTDHISTNTAIRLLSSSGMGNNDQVYFDDIEVTCAP